jgi:thiosulfate dehydrogenase
MKRIFRKGWYYLPAACIWLSCGNPAPVVVADNNNNCWRGAGANQIPVDSAGREIRYGYELISNTANYLGPAGTVLQISNGMNCQNCHLEAGTKPWGNNFGGVASVYPKFRNRSGTLETVARRINDCLERSLNGKPVDSNSREMKAMIAYMQWLGSDIAKGTRPKGSGIMQPALLTRAADPEKGKIVYTTTCQRCHGSNGEGQPNTTRTGYTYPPLWGANSYNTGAGMYRLSTLAGFVKNNMPDPVNYHAPALTDEQAWDVAAFINSQPRPSKDISHDWPDISRKPFDHPFGPYADSFSEKQHKYGPYGNIEQGTRNK